MAGNGQRVLLVLDNVCTGDQVRGLLPGHPAHRAVVTTRDTVSLPNADWSPVIRVRRNSTQAETLEAIAALEAGNDGRAGAVS